jgi:AcrR family transcriptional regulator
VVHRGPKTAARAGSALSREVIAAEALALLAREGTNAFGMRSLARALGVTPGALYKHVRDVEDVLGAMAGLVLSGVHAPPSDLPWQDWLRAFADSYRSALQQHPHAAPLLTSVLSSNSEAEFEIADRLLGVLHGAGFRGRALLDAYNAVVGAVCGYVGVELSNADVSPEWADRHSRALVDADPGRYPQLVAHRRQLRSGAFIVRTASGAEQPLTGGFRCMVDALVTGLAARLATTGGPPD